jgi:tetratricopeptide (TPR) repeat protein/Zn-dependent protease
LGVASLASLPLLAGEAAERVEFARPEVLPPKPQIPEKREEPIVPVSELHEALRLPRVDTSLTDEHSMASLAAYRVGEYEEAFEEAVLSLEPTPLQENKLYGAMTTYDPGNAETIVKPNGRSAIKAIDEALKPVLDNQEPREASARLSNAAAMMILRDYAMGQSAVPDGMVVAQELAYQAADIELSCPVLVNLTLFDGAGRYLDEVFLPSILEPAEQVVWTDYYAYEHWSEACADPALFFYLAQTWHNPDPPELEEAQLDIADFLRRAPELAGLGHSLRGDIYYWDGVYTRLGASSPFTVRHYFELAVEEYSTALALQPDDTAIRHGRALAYLELSKVGQNQVDKETLDKAIRDATAALEAEPESRRFRQTLAEAYEARGDYGTAAHLYSELVDTRQETSVPLALVPYSPLSHGADQYIELRVMVGESAPAVSALFDDEVIEPFMPRTYAPSVNLEEWSVPRGLDLYRAELLHYGLLRSHLLSGNYAAFEDHLGHVPEAARRNEGTLLLIGIAKLLDQSDSAPTPETQAAINNFSEEHSRHLEELEYEDANHSYLYDPISGGPGFKGSDWFYLEAGNFFRQHRQYRKALGIYAAWRSALERGQPGGKRRAEVEKLAGEAHFLNGDHDKALAAFGRATELRPDWPPYVVREAFMHEKLREFTTAADLYSRALKIVQREADWMDPSMLESYPPATIYSSYYPDPYYAAKHLGDMLLRRAEDYYAVQEEGENAETVRAKFGEAAQAYRKALDLSYGEASVLGTSVTPTAAANNLGVALLMAERERADEEEDYSTVINIFETLVQPVEEPTQDWQYNMAFDKYNPIFHLNLGWAYDLDDQPVKSKEQYLTAVRSDPSYYPALNDLGVMAAESGDLEEAKRFFDQAIGERRDYAHASHNLGVALLSSGGVGNILAAQHHLARAVSLDPSLAETKYDYIFDSELYFVRLDLGTSVPPDWEFAAHAERSTFAFSLGVVALLLWGIIRRTAYQKGRETLVGKVFDFMRERYGTPVSSVWSRVREGWLRLSLLGRPKTGRWWVTPLALVVTAPAVAIVQGWSLLWEDSAVKLVMVASLIYMAFVSLLVHHAGHAVMALRSRLRVTDSPWPAGIAQAVVLVAVGGPFVAPMPATSVEGEAEERSRHLVLLAGPLATICLAVVIYALYTITHIPLFRFGAILNLGLAAASLLLLPPLEGATIGNGHYHRWVLWAAIFVTVMSTLIVITSFF